MAKSGIKTKSFLIIIDKMMTHTKLDLKLEAYQYELPPELIASRPISGRDGSRLLVYDEQTDKITHSTFKDIVNFLPKNSTVVFNHSKVFPCRIKAKKKTGGSVEVFFLEFQSETNHFHVLIKSSSKKAVGLEIVMPDESIAVITDTRADGTFTIALQSNIEQLLSQHGKIPIPPYIRGGESDEQDLVDYQTVYAKEVGSVAAPTAGLHFTQDIFNQFEQNGIQRAELALHVGMGTFAPVKSETITDHQMHSERFCISNQDRNLINNASKIIAVGTTS
ncbi:MAG: tRNA preQ1(34) S-adenosylmethionine ribosyltransferase-isomerase QueA, partial [Bdellovibrionales bacterium CG22_combo_CG10-13_8_21_14_all_38_13]